MRIRKTLDWREVKIGKETVRAPDLGAPVLRGARFLDARVPGWWRKVSTSSLWLSSITSCVVGQLAIKAMLNGPLRDYNEGIQLLFPGLEFDDLEHVTGEYGFVRSYAYNAWYGKLENKRHLYVKMTDAEKRQYELFGRQWAWDELTRLWTEEIKARRTADREAKAQ